MCVLLWASNPEEPDECPNMTTPDNPFCSECEDRHPSFADGTVSTRPLPITR